MSVEFKCAVCGAGIRAPEERAGSTGKCPRCGELLRIPGRPPVVSTSAQVPPEAGSGNQTEAIETGPEHKPDGKHGGELPDVQIRIQVFELGRRYRALWQRHRGACLAGHVLLIVFAIAWVASSRKLGSSAPRLPRMDEAKRRLEADGLWALSTPAQGILRGRPLLVLWYGPDATKPDEAIALYYDEQGVVRGIVGTLYGPLSIEGSGQVETLETVSKLFDRNFWRTRAIRKLAGIDAQKELGSAKFTESKDSRLSARWIAGDDQAAVYESYQQIKGLIVEFISYAVPPGRTDKGRIGNDWHSATIVIRDGSW